MELPHLTGSQKTLLRGLGQKLDAHLHIGQSGLSPEVLRELTRLLAVHELVKVRFVGSDRHQRAALTEALALQAPALHVGSVGATALFYLPSADPKKSKILL